MLNTSQVSPDKPTLIRWCLHIPRADCLKPHAELKRTGWAKHQRQLSHTLHGSEPGLEALRTGDGRALGFAGHEHYNFHMRAPAVASVSSVTWGKNTAVWKMLLWEVSKHLQASKQDANSAKSTSGRFWSVVPMEVKRRIRRKTWKAPWTPHLDAETLDQGSSCLDSRPSRNLKQTSSWLAPKKTKKTMTIHFIIGRRLWEKLPSMVVLSLEPEELCLMKVWVYSISKPVSETPQHANSFAFVTFNFTKCSSLIFFTLLIPFGMFSPALLHKPPKLQPRHASLACSTARV